MNRFLSDEAGQAMAEYALIIALVVAAVIGTLTLFKEARDNIFSNILSKLSEAIGS